MANIRTDPHDAADAALARALQMLDAMFELQESHNREVIPGWRQRGLAFNRAIWVECAELLDHFGWKWWKQQQPDLGQVQLEIVDIWHFGLSMLLLEDAHDRIDTARQLLTLPHARSDGGGDPEVFRRSVEALARAALDNRFPVPSFVAVMAALPMDLRTLFERYVGKNALNRFRQANGYADGRYRKLWGGREDNVHLLEVVAELDVARSDYFDALQSALAQRYGAAAPERHD